MNAKATPMADADAMARLAKALAFICGPSDPATLAVQIAAASGAAKDIKKARELFVRLKPGDQSAALAMIST
jgi:hypothetical protein